MSVNVLLLHLFAALGFFGNFYGVKAHSKFRQICNKNIGEWNKEKEQGKKKIKIK